MKTKFVVRGGGGGSVAGGASSDNGRFLNLSTLYANRVNTAVD